MNIDLQLTIAIVGFFAGCFAMLIAFAWNAEQAGPALQVKAAALDRIISDYTPDQPPQHLLN